MLQRRQRKARVDGRRARGEDNRRKIVDALLSLVATGMVSPGAEDVADKAGVGLRTVFRHFADMDGLYAEMSERMRAEILPAMARPFRSTGWRERLRELADRRADVFERGLPFKIAGDARRQGSPFLTTQHEAFVKMQRDTLRSILPPKVDHALFEALDLALCFDSWRRLRIDQGLSPRDARAAVRLAVDALTSAVADAQQRYPKTRFTST